MAVRSNNRGDMALDLDLNLQDKVKVRDTLLLVFQINKDEVVLVVDPAAFHLNFNISSNNDLSLLLILSNNSNRTLSPDRSTQVEVRLNA